MIVFGHLIRVFPFPLIRQRNSGIANACSVSMEGWLLGKERPAGHLPDPHQRLCWDGLHYLFQHTPTVHQGQALPKARFSLAVPATAVIVLTARDSSAPGFKVPYFASHSAGFSGRHSGKPLSTVSEDFRLHARLADNFGLTYPGTLS